MKGEPHFGRDARGEIIEIEAGELLSIGSIESARLHHRITEHHRDAERLWCGVGPEGVARQMRHVEHRAHVDAAAEDRIGRRQRRDQLLDGGSRRIRSEEHTSELQSLMRISYAVFCLKK